MADRRVTPGRESAELLGELARELSVLVRRDIEVAAAERLPILRRAFLDLAALVAVLLAGLLALAACTVAAGVAIAAVVPGWAATLIVAAAWAVVAAGVALVLLRPRAQPREREELIGLLQLVSREHRLEELHSSREEARDEADQEVRRTSAALVKALLDEATEHQVEALPAVTKQEVANAAQAAAPDLLTDAIALLTAPARAGLTVLERLVEPTEAASQSELGRRPRRED
jgi:Putative Actinobacterial Holin-X, holin superfamily III